MYTVYKENMFKVRKKAKFSFHIIYGNLRHSYVAFVSLFLFQLHFPALVRSVLTWLGFLKNLTPMRAYQTLRYPQRQTILLQIHPLEVMLKFHIHISSCIIYIIE